jgi:D-sedoheptulose 7-phosphate isomerase
MTVDVQGYIDAYLAETIAAMAAFQDDAGARRVLADMADVITGALRGGGKLLIAGNGGSAGDAQHIAGEFIARLMYDRGPMAAMALTVDSSVLTATANDYGFAHVFERQVLALGRPGDVLLGISTSGSSPNILLALEAARRNGLVTIGFTGSRGDAMRSECTLLLEAPSAKTAIIQQIHIVAAHIVCALVERAMFPRE